MTPNSFSTTPRSNLHDLNLDRSLRHFNQIDLSRRWSISPRTLERWRWLKQGPRYLKIGGRVVYRLEDIEAFEKAQIKKAGQQLTDAGCE
ncbi:MAG: DNA-binding protein [Xanthobacteraceae bacterium]